MWKASRDLRLIEEVAASLGANVREADMLSRYAELVAEGNLRVNLTGAKDARALAEVSFADAFVLAGLLPGALRAIDVGAGGGAPAIPLAILRPELSIAMLEPRKKRALFLEETIAALGLQHRLSVEQRKLRDPDPLAGCDVAISRATFEPEVWLAHGLRLAPIVAVLGTGDPLPERSDAKLIEKRAYELPFSRAKRQIGVYERT